MIHSSPQQQQHHPWLVSASASAAASMAMSIMSMSAGTAGSQDVATTAQSPQSPQSDIDDVLKDIRDRAAAGQASMPRDASAWLQRLNSHNAHSSSSTRYQAQPPPTIRQGPALSGVIEESSSFSDSSSPPVLQSSHHDHDPAGATPTQESVLAAAVKRHKSRRSVVKYLNLYGNMSTPSSASSSLERDDITTAETGTETGDDIFSGMETGDDLDAVSATTSPPTEVSTHFRDWNSNKTIKAKPATAAATTNGEYFCDDDDDVTNVTAAFLDEIMQETPYFNTRRRSPDAFFTSIKGRQAPSSTRGRTFNRHSYQHAVQHHSNIQSHNLRHPNRDESRSPSPNSRHLQVRRRTAHSPSHASTRSAPVHSYGEMASRVSGNDSERRRRRAELRMRRGVLSRGNGSDDEGHGGLLMRRRKRKGRKDRIEVDGKRVLSVAGVGNGSNSAGFSLLGVISSIFNGRGLQLPLVSAAVAPASNPATESNNAMISKRLSTASAMSRLDTSTYTTIQSSASAAPVAKRTSFIFYNTQPNGNSTLDSATAAAAKPPSTISTTSTVVDSSASRHKRISTASSNSSSMFRGISSIVPVTPATTPTTPNEPLHHQLLYHQLSQRMNDIESSHDESLYDDDDASDDEHDGDDERFAPPAAFFNHTRRRLLDEDVSESHDVPSATESDDEGDQDDDDEDDASPVRGRSRTSPHHYNRTYSAAASHRTTSPDDESSTVPQQLSKLGRLLTRGGLSQTSQQQQQQPPVPAVFYRNGIHVTVSAPHLDPTHTHTRYTITVRLLRPNVAHLGNTTARTLKISRRYTDFATLHTALSRTRADLPSLPRKTFLKRFTSAVVDSRVIAFGELLGMIVCDGTLVSTDIALRFLGLVEKDEEEEHADGEAERGWSLLLWRWGGNARGGPVVFSKERSGTGLGERSFSNPV